MSSSPVPEGYTVNNTTDQAAYVSVTEAAQRLGVSENTIYRSIYAKRLAAVKIGRIIRIPASALEPSALEPAVK